MSEQTQANYNNLTQQASALFALEVGAAGLALLTSGLIAGGTVAYFLGDDPWHFSNEESPTGVSTKEGSAE